MPRMTNEPFFRTLHEGHYLPTAASRGPWDPGSLHGRVVAGLLAHEIERRHGDAAFLPARLTVDLYRLPDFSPARVTTSVVRGGHRIKVVDAEYLCGGVSMARASCQMLRRTENPEGNVWRPPSWNVPPPEEVSVPEGWGGGLGGMWAMRPITGAAFGAVPGVVVQKRAWLSEVRELVERVPLSPWVRVALAADFASPFANSGDHGLGYINTDITLYLNRLPMDEWIGFEVANHQATEGVALGACSLYDREGPIGAATVTALAQRRMKRG